MEILITYNLNLPIRKRKKDFQFIHWVINIKKETLTIQKKFFNKETKLCFATLAPTEYKLTKWLKITDFKSDHDNMNTIENKCNGSQLSFVRLNSSRRRYKISFLSFFKNQHWFSNNNGAVVRKNDCGPNDPKFEPRLLPPLWSKSEKLFFSDPCFMISYSELTRAESRNCTSDSA